MEFKVSRPALISSLSIAALFVLNMPQVTFAADALWQAQVHNGDISVNQGELSKAEAHFRLALQQVKTAPHNTEQLTECQNKLANALALEGKTEEAESLYQNSLAQLEKSYGKSSSKLNSTLLALGSFFEAEGDHGSAMSLYQRAISINEKSYSQFSPAISNIVHHPNASLGSIGISPYKPGPTALQQQAELEASDRMLKALPVAKDLVKDNDASDKELLKDFQKQIINTESANVKNPRRTAIALPAQNHTEL